MAVPCYVSLLRCFYHFIFLIFSIVFYFYCLHFFIYFTCFLCVPCALLQFLHSGQRISMTCTRFLLHRRWVFLEEAWQSHLSLRWWSSHAFTFHTRVNIVSLSYKWLFLPLIGHRAWWPWIPSSISADSKPQMWKKRGTTDSDPCVTHQTYMNLTQWLPCCGLVLVRSPPVYPHDFASRAAVPPRSHLSDGCLLEASVLMPLTIDIRAAIWPSIWFELSKSH